MLLQTPVGAVAVLSPDLLLFIAHSVHLITCSIENQSFNRFWSIWLMFLKGNIFYSLLVGPLVNDCRELKQRRF